VTTYILTVFSALTTVGTVHCAILYVSCRNYITNIENGRKQRIDYIDTVAIKFIRDQRRQNAEMRQTQ